MKLSVTVNGAASDIEILTAAPACRFRIGDAPESLAEVAVPEPGVYSVLLDGRAYDARVEEDPGGILVVVIDGFHFEIAVRDPRRYTQKAGGSAGEGIQSVTAPMPGRVVRVLVSPGETVEAGRGLVVVEAMKMQNELKAPRAGKVLTVPAKEGATVLAGEILATLE